jgi:CrcB protein
MQWLWVGLGGFLGANSRYLVTQWAAQRWGADFPYGTLIVNVSGSFLIAFFLTLATGRLAISTEVRLFVAVGFLVSTEVRLFVAVGFLGGFTTFSSFSYETLQLAREGAVWAAGLNMLGETVLALIGVILGIVLAQLLQHLGGT